jgi:indolepyruvate ferredoxin oxidoreductase beta subunit
MKMDLVIAGVGGQGNLFASEVISLYAMGRGYNVLGTETIGAAQRGGSVVSHVRISEGQIYSPLVPRGQADVLLGLEPLEMLRHSQRLSPQGQYLLNMYKIPTVMCNMGLDRYPSDQEIERAITSLGVRGYIIPATRRAYEIGNAVLANVVMLGALCALSPFFDHRAMRRTLAEMAPKRALELNLTAFDEGLSLVQSAGEGRPGRE